MSVYMTEAEQIAAIKKWWQRYSTYITLVLSVIMLTVAAYRYWHWHQEKIAQQASNAYEHLMQSLSNQDNKGVRSYASLLLKEYNDTIYADAARLTLAKLLVAKENYSQAEEMLNQVSTHCNMLALKQIAQVRLARLLTAEKSYDKALGALTRIDGAIYEPVVNELRGDIYAATGQYDQAISAYRKAMAVTQAKGVGNAFLEMKTNELAAMTTHSTQLTEKKSQTT